MLCQKSEPRVLCIGNFDGVHRGHQAILAQALSLSPHVIVLTFDPHPKIIFNPETAPFLITSTQQKHDLLRHYGACEITRWPFSIDLAQVPAPIFLNEVIIKQIKPDHILIGADFRFGKNRDGDPSLIKNMGSVGGYQTHIIEAIHDERAMRYSSSRVREALSRGDIHRASRILGHDFIIEEEVIHGDKRGREIGFPTANQERSPYMIIPSYGVYASYAYIEEQQYKACTNIGIRPMFEVQKPLIETHIFDFDGDLYGQKLRVQPVKKLRSEAKYDSLDALIKQITIDCQNARDLLTS